MTDDKKSTLGFPNDDPNRGPIDGKVTPTPYDTDRNADGSEDKADDEDERTKGDGV